MQRCIILVYTLLFIHFGTAAQVLNEAVNQEEKPETPTTKRKGIPLFGSWNKIDSLPGSSLPLIGMQPILQSYTLHDSIQQELALPDSILAIENNMDSTEQYEQQLILALDSIFAAKKDSVQMDAEKDSTDVFKPIREINLGRVPRSQRLLKAYEASLTVNNKTHFNRYRIINWDIYNDTINPYKLDVVPYFDHRAYGYLTKNHPDLYSTNWFTGDTTKGSDLLSQTLPFDVFMASRNNLIKADPKLATHRWNDLPDPPKVDEHTYLSNITNVKLDYVMSNKNLISTPEKLSKRLIKANPWRLRGNTSLHLSQSTVTEWENGGEGFFSLLGIVTMDADYNRKNLKWENYGELRLGAMQQNDEEMRKNEDRFRITSNVGIKTSKKSKWYYSMNMDFNTQLFNGYEKNREPDDLPTSGFLAPARFYLSAGMDFKEKKAIKVFLSPLTYKLTYVRDTAKYSELKYGIEKGQNKREEIGGYIRAEINYDLAKQVHLKSKLYFFTDYTRFLRKIDLDWENILDFKITHLLSARLSFHFKYDDDVLFKVGTTTNDEGEEVPKYGTKLQFKELLSIGFNYRF